MNELMENLGYAMKLTDFASPNTMERLKGLIVGHIHQTMLPLANETQPHRLRRSVNLMSAMASGSGAGKEITEAAVFFCNINLLLNC